MKKLTAIIAIGLCALVAQPAISEDKLADTAPIARDKLRADKKYVVAINLPLLEREASQFWPVYDAYQSELAANDARVAKLILEYQEADSTGKLNDTVAKRLAEEMLALDDDDAKLRHRYFAKLLQVLPPMKASRYLQIEGRIRAAARYEVESRVPLIDDRKQERNQVPSLGI